MFEVEDLMTAAVVPLVTRYACAVMLDLDQRWPYPRCHAQAGPQRRRVPVRLHFHAALVVDDQRVQDLVYRESIIGCRHQMRPFHLACLTDGHGPSADCSAPACQATSQELLIQFGEIG